MNTSPAQKQTRILVQAAAAVCEEKKGQHTRILELDPVDSGLSDFFLVTSATNQRQAVAIADEIELRLKHNFGAYPNSVEGRRNGEWILLDYVDFVIHVFLSEKRAFYDIERLRKSASAPLARRVRRRVDDSAQRKDARRARKKDRQGRREKCRCRKENAARKDPKVPKPKTPCSKARSQSES